ncbi:MAG: hypothetical protein Q9177_002901 [Variospora cf. flavescens]
MFHLFKYSTSPRPSEQYASVIGTFDGFINAEDGDVGTFVWTRRFEEGVELDVYKRSMIVGEIEA